MEIKRFFLLFALVTCAGCGSNNSTPANSGQNLSIQMSDVARNPNGSVMYMVQSSEYVKSIGKPLPAGEMGAVEYCKSQGMHLPSSREWAHFAVSLGAAGIIEVNQYKNESGYSLIETRNADGSTDKFYFSNNGYPEQSGDLGDNPFWSSSFRSDISDTAFEFDSWNGNVLFSDTASKPYAAVRCVK